MEWFQPRFSLPDTAIQVTIRIEGHERVVDTRTYRQGIGWGQVERCRRCDPLEALSLAVARLEEF